jgi:hypothetical protein
LLIRHYVFVKNVGRPCGMLRDLDCYRFDAQSGRGDMIKEVPTRSPLLRNGGGQAIESTQ